jgi:hypothetical protein
MKPLRLFVVFGAVCVIIAGFSCTPEPGTSTPPVTIIKLDPPGPKDPDLAVKAAVVIGSCASDGGWYNPQVVTTEIYYTIRGDGPSSEAIERTTHCLAEKADGCAGLERCFATTVHALAGAEACVPGCKPGGVYKSCVKETIEMVTDCSRLGMECYPGGCSSYPKREPCDPATADPCKDGIPWHCLAGSTYQWRGLSCAEHDLICAVIEEVPQPLSRCVGTGPVCDSVSVGDDLQFVASLGCEGTTAHACINDYEHVYDCGELAKGFSCQQIGPTRFECGLAAECNMLQDQSVCDGNDVVLCNGGRVDRVSCTALGFEGCDPDLGLCFPSPASRR